MHARWTLTGVVALALVATGPSYVVQATGPTVTIDDLGPSGFTTGGRGVNATSFTTGWGNDGVADFGFTQQTAPLTVPLPVGASDLRALAVNNAGVVTGRYKADDGFFHPFRYDSVSNAISDVPLLANATSGTGNAVNASGVVAGFGNPGGKTHGFLQAPGGSPVDVDPTGNFSSLSAINASNVAVGMALQGGVVKAVRYDGTLHPLATLGGVSAAATGINTGGLIVGYASYPSSAGGQTVAARWTDDATVNALGTLGGAWSMAWAVNSAGDIVGASLNASGEQHAFVWKNGAMQDLNDLVDPSSGWVLVAAYGVNDAGVIVGDGLLDGAPRGFRLTPATGTDNTAPVISWVKASPDSLSPPNHQMASVTLTLQSSDDSGDTPKCELSRISSSDPDNGTGDGDTAGDTLITGPLAAKLRAERSASKERVYTLTVQCTDAAGNASTSSAFVRVSKSANGK
jgi:probable HAF family extracellular repeat protein